MENEITLLKAQLERAETAMRDAQGQGTLNDAWDKLETYFEKSEK